MFTSQELLQARTHTHTYPHDTHTTHTHTHDTHDTPNHYDGRLIYALRELVTENVTNCIHATQSVM